VGYKNVASCNYFSYCKYSSLFSRSSLTNNQTKAKLFPVLLLLVVFFSCNEEDLSPEAQVQGKYELIYQDNQGWSDDLFDYVNTFELRSDGTFHREDVTRNLDSDEVLGYRSYGSGTYTLADGEVTFVYEELYIMGVADINYLPKDSLISYGQTDFSESYSILENYKRLEYICLPNSGCGEPQAYTRID
jgi:hypothetical protein